MFILQNKKILQDMITDKGVTISDLSQQSPVLLVFLRHLGCVFCRETLSDLKRLKGKITAMGTRIVLVHMAELQEASDLFEKYEFRDIHHVADNDNQYYQEFGLSKGDFKQLFGFRSWIGMGRATLKGNFPEKVMGDPTQLPGIFLIENDKISKSFIYNSVGDYPDYLELASR